jgi:hypothetical protein
MMGWCWIPRIAFLVWWDGGGGDGGGCCGLGCGRCRMLGLPLVLFWMYIDCDWGHRIRQWV